MKYELSEKRLERLSDPYIAQEVKTIEIMARINCLAHHKGRVKENGLCDECREFVEYATKRLACCPYGANKPVCKNCRIHCFQKSYKDRAKEIMGYAGPRLVFTHPILTARHVAALFRKAPDKPRNRKQ